MTLGLTPNQLEERKTGVYGTDAADIMAGHWKELWAVKTGRAEPKHLYDRITDPHMLRRLSREQLDLAALLGNYTEPLNRAWFELKTGREVTRVGETWTHPTLPFMRCHADGATMTERGQPCVWDAKWTSRADPAFIKRCTPQMTHNAIVGGYEYWCLSIFVGNGKWETVEQEVDPFYAARLLSLEAAFWECVERDEEPRYGEPAVLPPAPVRRREVDLTGEPSTAWPNWGQDMISVLGKYGNVVEPWKLGNLYRSMIKDLLPEDVGLVIRGNWRIRRDKAGKVTIGVEKEPQE